MNREEEIECTNCGTKAAEPLECLLCDRKFCEVCGPNILSFCSDCGADICENCDCKHDNWGA